MSEDWGPWIEHDGVSAAPIGMFAEVTEKAVCDGPTWKHGDVRTAVVLLEDPLPYSWHWEPPPLAFSRVIRYRIRKPKGLTILEGLLENLPHDVDA